MKRFLLYLMVILGVSVTSCSNLYEELLVNDVPKKDISVADAKISGAGGAYKLTFTTTDTFRTASVVSVNGTKTSVAGSVTINSSGTKSATFDISRLITTSTMGGTIPVTIRADGFIDTAITADYTPDVILNVTESKDVFNEDSLAESEPVATVNYHDSITFTKTYAASDGTNFTDWEEAKSFMAEPANAGKTVSVTFTATADKDKTKTATATTVFKIKKAVTIDSLDVGGTGKVGETLSALPYYFDPENGNAKTEYPRNDLSYQWYIADTNSGTGTAISGATGKSYTVKPGDSGKYIYVQAVQTHPNTHEVLPAVQSSYSAQVSKAEMSGSKLELSYPASSAIVCGNSPSAADILASGTLAGGANNAEIAKSTNNGQDGGYTLSVSDTALSSSDYVTVTITASGYESITKEVFVTVKAPSPSAPALSTDVANISNGNIKFAAADSTLEYSLDGGTTWHNVDTAEFVAPTELFVRTKATGTEGEAGYIAPSDKVGVTVGDGNKGIKVSAKIITVTIDSWGDISLNKLESGNTVTLTVTEGYTDLSWNVDGTELSASAIAGFTLSGGTLTIDKSLLAKGTYRITVSGTKDNFVYSSGIWVEVQ